MKLYVLKERELGKRDPMIYGHFIEHFHRQIYGGVYDPGNELSDEDGFRTDVLDAMRKIKVPILRWPGGMLCVVIPLEKCCGQQQKAHVR